MTPRPNPRRTGSSPPVVRRAEVILALLVVLTLFPAAMTTLLRGTEERMTREVEPAERIAAGDQVEPKRRDTEEQER